jgi:hypothetical protein
VGTNEPLEISKTFPKGALKPLAHLTVLFFAVSSAYITFFNYSRVPYWDSFQYVFTSSTQFPSLDFLLTQHNEHRIFWTKILFFIENNLFDGTGYFLIAMNFVFAACIYFALIKLWHLFRPSGTSSFITFLITVFSGFVSFSLLQIENLGWEFQSQFFLAYLLPLLLFVFLFAKSQHGNLSLGNFVILWFVAGASVVTMGNGILAMPILGFVLLLQKKWVLSGVSFASSLVFVLLYTSGYQAPGHHSSFDSLITNPVGVISHFVYFLGNPIGALIPSNEFLGGFVFGFGLFVGITNVVCFSYILFSKSIIYKFAPLLGVNLYLLGSAFLVAIGRNEFGVGQALAGRYSTPALLLIVTTIILVSALTKSRLSRTLVGTSILVMTVFLVMVQFAYAERLLNFDDQKPFASIAASQGIEDLERLQKIFPSAQFVLDEVQKMNLASQTNIFSSWGEVSKNGAVGNLGECEGFIDEVSATSTEGTYSVVGWLRINYNPLQRYNLWHIRTDSNDLFVAMGYMRPDVAAALGESWQYFGFRGYSIGAEPASGAISSCEAAKVN